ncbi:MAG: Nif3-like dinuclear metal center hexameric protein [Magnetococcales bacterium]|nr:Nif3-like dinuclear metal center hexameric protein [Magnetococcales bacterium]MBF0150443.1 Nif3-like dinuclear metal center hexameric protein [Magnetococcales bacterium]
MAKLERVEHHLAQILCVEQFSDYCPNGVQVRGRRTIKRVITGVSACLELFQAALARKADLILVHHGLFWDKDSRVIQGQMHQRLQLLMKHHLTLMAFHLPLDAHPQLGNNARLLRLLGIEKMEPFGQYRHQTISFMGSLDKAVTVDQLVKTVKKRLRIDAPIILPFGPKKIRRIAVCSGGAPELIHEAKAKGADLFLTGEANEPLYYFAREEKIHCIAAGHHATETLGVRALGNHLAHAFDLRHFFHDTHNPL